MSAKANPTKVGLFVVAGLAIGVIGLTLFSSFRFFTPTYPFILYFDSSLNGLSEGAPVKFRGVTVGTVKRVMIHFNQRTNDYAMPVIIEIREDLVREHGTHRLNLADPDAIRQSIKNGLRGSLAAESLVTGVLYIDLDAQPWAPPPVFHQIGKFYIEIPTRPSQTQQLLKNLAEVDIKGLQEKLSALLDTLDNKVQEFKAEEISNGLTNLLTSLNQVVRMRELTNSIAALGNALEQYRTLGERLDKRVPVLADSITNTLARADLTLAGLRGAADDLRNVLGPDSALRNDLNLALTQIASAAQSLAELAEFLKRYPNSLITGRKMQNDKP